MSRLLLLGTGPLFSPEVKVFNGQALRTWHFTRPLLAQGHQIDLVVLPPEGTPLSGNPPTPYAQLAHKGVAYRQITLADPQDILEALQRLLDASRYDALIAVNHNAAAYACRLACQLPLWADLNGYIMGEAQAKCHVYGSDAYLRHFWQRERTALLRADRFSAVSYKQMYATLGELGTLGRLNQHTFSHPFVSVIPNAAFEEFLDPASYPDTPRYRGTLFPNDAFAVLWSGGFNTWTDTRTLAGALSLAMEQLPELYFVATGGIIPGHDEKTYHAFREQIAATGFEERCLFLNWVEARELFPLYHECDLGINIDSLNYETVFGARNRLTNMMAAGLPVLSTLGTELSEILQEMELGYVVPIGDAQALTEALLRAAHHPEERLSLSERARNFAATEFSYETTTRALLRWAQNPTRSPDNQAKLQRWPEEQHLERRAVNSLEEEAVTLQQHDIPELLRSRAELLALREKPLYRLYKKLFG